MAYYWAIKDNDLLIHISTWMNFKIIVPSERSQAKKRREERKRKKEEYVLYDSIYIKF